MGRLRPAADPARVWPIHDIAREAGQRLDAAREDVFGFLLDELADRSPTVMVIEDLHWADEATLDVLAPLSPDAVERLAWKAGRSSARLHATTAGNPYFVNEVVASSASGVPAREPATSR